MLPHGTVSMRGFKRAKANGALDFGNMPDSTLIGTIALAGGLICTLYLFYTIPAGFYKYSLFNLATAVLCLLIYLFNKWKWYNIGFWSFGCIIPIFMVVYVHEFGFINAEMYIIGGGIFMSYLVRDKKYLPEGIWIFTLALFLVAKAFLYFSGRIQDMDDLERFLYFSNGASSIILIYLTTRFFGNKEEGRRTELVESNELKEKLLSLVSHDLRTPFNSIKGLLELKKEGDISDEEWDEHLSKLNSEVDRTSSFIDNLLFWVKQQMNGIEAQHQTFSVNDVVKLSLYQLQATVRDKGIKISQNTTGHCNVHSDQEMLGIIIRNIFSNAIKFTHPQSGTIEVHTEKIDNHVRLQIKDNGIGMSQDTVNKLFFGNVNSSDGTLHEKGFGIGMQLVKTFADMLHISLDVQSVEGSGTCFTLSIPIST